MSVLTPNMNLIQPTIGVDTGLTWEDSFNANMLTLANHDHSPGNGVSINQSAIVLTGDFSFTAFNATNLRSARFSIQTSPLATASDLACVYVSGVDLYFNDANGTQIQMTSGGAVLATSSGISSGTATASFSSGVLIVNAASNTPANIQGASYKMGNNVVSSKYLTLAPPNAMAADFTLTFPLIPASTKLLTLDTSGNIGYANSVSASQIADGSLVYTQLLGGFKTPTIQKFTSGSGTYTAPTGPAPLYLRVRMVGGGGGGAGGGQNNTGTFGTDGGNSTFGTLLAANGGKGGVGSSAAGLGGAGGTAALVAPAIGAAFTGSYGNTCGVSFPFTSLSNTNNWVFMGGNGGNTPFGGAGGGAAVGSSHAAAANTGSGGGGGSCQGSSASSVNCVGGGGGGAGGYIDVIIPSPSGTYTYAVGASGAGGAAGTSGLAGSAGGVGVIIVEEFYQ